MVELTVGVLALQGAVQPHENKLRSLGVTSLQVRTPEELAKCDAIVLPGGESTTMLHLLKLNRLWEPLKEFTKTKPAFGVCAGAILLAEDVDHPKQNCLSAIPIKVTRNAYGRQSESFLCRLTPTALWKPKREDARTPEGVFIRAPRIEEPKGDVKVLLRHEGEPVLVERGNVLAATFHPELSSSNSIHEYFLEKIRKEECTDGRTASELAQ